MEEDPQLILHILLLLGLLALSAFFSSAEVAFVSLSPAKTRVLSEKKTRSAKLVVALKAQPHRFLATILIGNNLTNIFSAGFATVIATRLFGSAGLGIATGVMTFLILVFGEFVPKAFAQKYAESYAQIACYPLYILSKILMPITWLAESFMRFLGAEHIEKISEDEIVAMVDLGTEGGEIKEHEKEMIENVLEFTNTRVEEVMAHRVEIDAIEKNKTLAEARQVFGNHNHTRLPVYDKTIDRIIGFVTPRHLLENLENPEIKLEQLSLYPVIFTPASRPIRSLFQEFKSRHLHLAIVVDEHGGTLGLVTLEDLLEEIVGEIEDERDVPTEGIVLVDNNTLEAPADTQLSEIDDQLKTELAKGKYVSKNIAYLILEKFGKLPKRNAKLKIKNAIFTILEVTANKIKKVKVEKI